MRVFREGVLGLTLLASAFAGGCASSGGERAVEDPNLLTREEILSVNASNLYEVIGRLRPRWLQVRSQRSFNMQTEVVVLQNDVYMGNTDILFEMPRELAFEIQYLEGARAAAAMPALLSGLHIEGAIIVKTRSSGGGGGG